MALHIERGKAGEQMGCSFLEKKQFRILFCNWRSSHWEIDVIAEKDGIIHFIEVKTRHGLKFGYPEEAVSKKKFDNLKRAAVAFLNKYPHRNKIQFDILSILRLPRKPTEFFFIEDVYL
jgi:putative endonuclease